MRRAFPTAWHVGAGRLRKWGLGFAAARQFNKRDKQDKSLASYRDKQPFQKLVSGRVVLRANEPKAKG